MLGKSLKLKYSILIVILLFASFVTGYWSVFGKLFARWNSGDNSYCFLVPVLAVYICWELKNKFDFYGFQWPIWSLIPLILSIGLVFLGEIGSMETFIYIGIWGVLVSFIAFLYGSKIKALFFPLLVLIFIVPLPPFINRMLTFNFKLAASSMAVWMMRLTGISVIREGNIIDLGIDQLQVVDACSGLRYFMPMLLTALLIGYFFSRGWWKKTILLVAVIPLSILFNSVRIYITGLMVAKGYGHLAHNAFHDLTGWLIFIMAGGVLVVVALLLNRFGPKPQTIAGPATKERKDLSLRTITLTLVICLTVWTSGYAFNCVATGSDGHYYRVRNSFDSFPMQIGSWQGTKSYLSQDILDSLWADDYVNARYLNNGSGNVINLFIPYYQYQSTRHTAHAPQSCLLGGGFALLDSKEKIIRVSKDRSIQIMLMQLEKDNVKVIGGYFFFQRGRVITSPWWNKWYLIYDSFTRKRTDGALVRIEMPVPPGQKIEDTYGVMETFVSKLWPILPGYVPI